MEVASPVFPLERTNRQESLGFSPVYRPGEINRPDSLLAVEIEERLWRDHGLRILEAGHIRVKVSQGVARLYGHVAKALNRTLAQEIAWMVRGVKGVQNDLEIDDDLKVKVAAALARDKRTRSYILPVGCSHGWIVLGGIVPDAEVQAAAESIAASVPQVRGVIGLPAISGQGLPPLRQAIQPEIGWNVYGKNDRGSVAEIVIDPCSRLVTHIVVRRDGVDHRMAEKGVLMPADQVDFAQEGAVWLKSGTDFKNYPGFDPSQYPFAPEEWRPPFPYEAGAIRWPGEML
jgi:osmotically-inducible protein OsmY